MTVYGLIGEKLSHSFSKKYFEQKFEALKLADHYYKLFELATIDQVKNVVKHEGLKGFNVTVPYKEAIIPWLDQLDSSAKKVGAVNVVKVLKDMAVGYNSDYFGFKHSLQNWLSPNNKYQALVLGAGGASKAVTAALHDLNIPFAIISRNELKGDLTYDQLMGNQEFMSTHNLIINSTPVGMHPNIQNAPRIPYEMISDGHYLYDLVYNPELTEFLKRGQQRGAVIKNGLEMLHLQAEKSWEIWNAKQGE